MGLLTLLRPADTRGWHRLDAEEQQLLLDCARRSGDLPTLRTLAELPGLAGTARETLMAEREPSVRKKILSRRDLTDTERTTLFAQETRASVLAAVAGSFPDDQLDTLLAIAENSRGTSLTEALLRSGRLTAEQRLRMLRDLAARKSYHALQGGISDKVAAILPADPELLVWFLAGSGYGRNSWNLSRVVNRLAGQVTSSSDALTLLDAMALAGHADHVAGFLRNLLESSHIVSGRNLLPLGEIHTLARELNVRITHGKDGWAKLAAPVGSLLAQLEPLLVKMGETTSITQSEEQPDEDTAWESISSGEIVSALAGDRRLDATAIARLACNPNHNDATAGQVAQLTFQTPGAALAVIACFDDVSDAVWSRIAATGSYQAVLEAGQTIEHVGAEALARTLSSERYRDSGTSGYRYWRSSWPLLGSGPLEWLLEGTPHPDAEKVALNLAVQDVCKGGEALAFKLLAGQVGDDAAAWDVVDGLIDSWDGTFAELVAVARQVNV